MVTRDQVKTRESRRRARLVLVCVASLLRLPLCAHAQTAAGTPITDSASASYVAPSNSGQTVNAPSNSVTVTVAEVAGMTLTGSAVTDTTGGANILPGHVLFYDYTITNVGNDTNQFVILGTATITGAGTQTSLKYSTNGGTTYTTVSGASATTATVAEGGTVQVRVTALCERSVGEAHDRRRVVLHLVICLPAPFVRPTTATSFFSL